MQWNIQSLIIREDKYIASPPYQKIRTICCFINCIGSYCVAVVRLDIMLGNLHLYLVLVVIINFFLLEILGTMFRIDAFKYVYITFV